MSDTKQFMSVAEQLREEGYKEGYKEGLKEEIKENREEGKRKKKFEVAIEMLRAGMVDSQVIAFTGVTVNDIKRIKKQFFITSVIYKLGIEEIAIDKISKNLSDEGRKIVISVAEQLREEGRREGRKEEQFEIAKKMLQSGMDDSQIIAFTGITADDIKQIKNP